MTTMGWQRVLSGCVVGVAACAAEAPVMQAVSNAVTGQIEISEAGRPVLRYNYRTVEPGELLAKVSANNRKYAVARSDYIHPLYGLNGEELTRDWAVDHPHHRGIYWAWPEVMVGKELGDLHALQKVFARPTGKVQLASGVEYAQIEAENQWLWADREPIVNEVATIRAYRATEQGRALDLTLRFTALKEGVTLARRGTSHYGGLNIRLAQVTGQAIAMHIDPTNAAPRRAWSDVSGVFPGGRAPTGVTVLQDPRNPEYPGEYYQAPALAWCQPTFPTSGTRFALPTKQPLVLRYRIWIHAGGQPEEAAMAGIWSNFQTAATQGVQHE